MKVKNKEQQSNISVSCFYFQSTLKIQNIMVLLIVRIWLDFVLHIMLLNYSTFNLLRLSHAKFFKNFFFQSILLKVLVVQ